MLCENQHCIYCNENNQCILDVITIDGGGLCNECILVSVDANELREKKQHLLKQLHGYVWDGSQKTDG